MNEKGLQSLTQHITISLTPAVMLCDLDTRTCKPAGVFALSPGAIPMKTKTVEKLAPCVQCGDPVPVRNSMAAALIEKVGRPMCAECRTKVCEVKA